MAWLGSRLVCSWFMDPFVFNYKIPRHLKIIDLFVGIICNCEY